MRITFICTLEPATGKYLMRPACELYRSCEITEQLVERREYIEGIPTWLKTIHGIPLNSLNVKALDEYF